MCQYPKAKTTFKAVAFCCTATVNTAPPAAKPEAKLLAKPSLAKSRWKKLAGTAMFINRLGKSKQIYLYDIILPTPLQLEFSLAWHLIFFVSSNF